MKTRILQMKDRNGDDLWQIWKDREYEPDEERKTDEEIRQSGECLATGLRSATEAEAKQSELEKM